MGLFCASIHLKTEDYDAILVALEAEAQASVVLPSQDGWISAYAERLVEDGPEQLAAALSAELGVATISFAIHDSDIARYWLHESGRLCDTYDSWPGYFEGNRQQPSGGDPEVLARLANDDDALRKLRRVLAADHVFADDLVEQVAAILGIENGRATHDYSHLTDAETEDYLSSALADASQRLQTRPLDQYDETTVALVHAAARGDVTELTRMAATGASVDMAAPGPLPGGEMVAKGVVAPQPEMTPLIAAVVNRQQNAVAALLALGAKPDLLHHLHGSAVHVAAGMGNVTALEALLDAGGNPVAPGLQTQTPIQAVAAGREAFAMMDHTRQLMEELGLDTTALDLIGVVSPAADDWSRCEDLLRSRGATD